MPWNTNNKFSILLPVVGVVFLTSVAGYVISHLFLQAPEEDIKRDKNKRRNNSIQKLKAKSKKIVKIPRNSIGTVIGRHGVKIKFIEDKTKTTISFPDEYGDEVESTCIISGRLEKVEEASDLIIQSIEDVPVIQYLELSIPRFAVGKVMGINGITVKYLSRKTGANFIAENRTNSKGSTRQIMIKGTCEQIMEAKHLIYEIIQREEEMLNKMNSSVASISQRTKVKFQENECIPNGYGVFDRKAGEPFQDDNCFEGIVSAVDSPFHFWFQIKSQSIIKLNTLVEEMTTYYDNEANRELFKSEEFKYGDIVTARFPHDQKWYRGTICKHEVGDDPSKYVVYFVDFGDTDEVDLENICELRTDFLQLKFQAVEAYLATIDPTSTTPEAMDLFTKLAYVNLLDSVKVKIIGYKDDDKVGIPFVQLINVNSDQEIDIAEEMIRRGFAKRIGIQL